VELLKVEKESNNRLLLSTTIEGRFGGRGDHAGRRWFYGLVSIALVMASAGSGFMWLSRLPHTSQPDVKAAQQPSVPACCCPCLRPSVADPTQPSLPAKVDAAREPCAPPPAQADLGNR
jgi:hypothetical protein